MIVCILSVKTWLWCQGLKELQTEERVWQSFHVKSIGVHEFRIEISYSEGFILYDMGRDTHQTWLFCKSYDRQKIQKVKYCSKEKIGTSSVSQILTNLNKCLVRSLFRYFIRIIQSQFHFQTVAIQKLRKDEWVSQWNRAMNNKLQGDIRKKCARKDKVTVTVCLIRYLFPNYSSDVPNRNCFIAMRWHLRVHILDPQSYFIHIIAAFESASF